MRRLGVFALSGALVFWPNGTDAQPVGQPTIGFLHSQSPDAYRDDVAAFEKGLEEQGIVAGKNATLDYVWARNNVSQLPSMAAALLTRRPSVVVAAGGDLSAQAAKSVTASVPIVFIVGADPVATGLVPALNRPSGNLTGVTLFTVTLTPKRLQLLRELKPRASRVAVLAPSGYPRSGSDMAAVEVAARALGLSTLIHMASNPREIREAFSQIAKQRPDAVLVISNPLFSSQSLLLANLGLEHRLPLVCPVGVQARSGCLMSYGPKRPQSYRTAGVLAARVLKGERPADLPVQQPTSFELVLNLRTAKTLGIEFPATLLAIADEVIE